MINCFNQVIKVMATSWCGERGPSTLQYSPPKYLTKLRDVLQNTWLVFFKTVKLIKNQKTKTKDTKQGKTEKLSPCRLRRLDGYIQYGVLNRVLERTEDVSGKTWNSGKIWSFEWTLSALMCECSLPSFDVLWLCKTLTLEETGWRGEGYMGTFCIIFENSLKLLQNKNIA